MPKSRQRNKSPKKVVTAADKRKINETYTKKLVEYNAMLLDDLLELARSKKIKGRYENALHSIIQAKTQKQAKNESINTDRATSGANE